MKSSAHNDLLSQRLRALAFWLAFSAIVAVLWVALPTQAATAATEAQAATAASTPQDRAATDPSAVRINVNSQRETPTSPVRGATVASDTYCG
jgi:ferric-dicitrate binding protein FerR (iron transport regulator)